MDFLLIASSFQSKFTSLEGIKRYAYSTAFRLCRVLDERDRTHNACAMRTGNICFHRLSGYGSLHAIQSVGLSLRYCGEVSVVLGYLDDHGTFADLSFIFP